MPRWNDPLDRILWEAGAAILIACAAWVLWKVAAFVLGLLGVGMVP